MSETSCLIETIGKSRVVRFTEATLVFPDQLHPVEAELMSDAPEHIQSVVLDFTGVSYISSSIWGRIIFVNKQLREADRQLRLCNLADHLQGALEAMKLDQLLAVFSSRDEALAGP